MNLLIYCTILALAAWQTACAGESDPRQRIPAAGPWNHGAVLPATAQMDGDPVRGREILLHGDYMTCGLPYRMWEFEVARPFIAGGFGANDAVEPVTLAGRSGVNADLPYYINAFDAPDGTKVVNGNCLMCHGGMFNGQVILGLPNATADFTGSGSIAATDIDPGDEFWDLLGLNAAERVHAERMFKRAEVMLPYTRMRTIGQNPAELFALVLMVHHDRDSLAWSDEAVTESLALSLLRGEDSDPKVTSDPAPWWRVYKKNAMFYNGMARGDHRGTMALATSVCVEDVTRAAEVDAQFVDMQAFIKTVRAPAYPFAIDRGLANKGESLFLSHCAGCHGTYDQDESKEWYPNLLIPLDVIGTDDVVANGGVIYAPELVEWYNASFYGRITKMAPDDPFAGYMPPPLDGIWATAPFLHNGSVPNLELVLNSAKRPKFWRRVDYDSTNFDEQAVGWPFIEVSGAQRHADVAERKHIYDTTYWSQSNAGHTFGDALSDNERRAVLEYLKTL